MPSQPELPSRLMATVSRIDHYQHPVRTLGSICGLLGGGQHLRRGCSAMQSYFRSLACLMSWSGRARTR